MMKFILFRDLCDIYIERIDLIIILSNDNVQLSTNKSNLENRLAYRV